MILRKFRITFLLYIFVVVAVTSWSTRARNTSWETSLWVVVYPINGDGSEAVQHYIDSLSSETFAPIEHFLAAEARRYGIGVKTPVKMKLADQIERLPPAPPRQKNLFSVVLWSLHLRYWAWRHGDFPGPTDIRMFNIYYDPQNAGTLAHSLGLQKGFLGVVNGFGSKAYSGRNNVVIAHEMLHTLGAADKYDVRSGQPIFPQGFADPHQDPPYPQTRAELMAGHIPISPTDFVMPNHLGDARVGPQTALEIGWGPR